MTGNRTQQANLQEAVLKYGVFKSIESIYVTYRIIPINPKGFSPLLTRTRFYVAADSTSLTIHL